jgi:hypothetical protein
MAKRTKKSKGTTSRYRPEFVALARALCEDNGADNRALAARFGIGIGCLRLWKRQYPDFDAAILEGKAIFDTRMVVPALLKRALGYEYNEVTIGGEHGGKTVTKHVPPDVTACIFWLCNRNPQRWRQRSQTELLGKDGADLVLNVTVTKSYAKALPAPEATHAGS